jgi:hypothetical protein
MRYRRTAAEEWMHPLLDVLMLGFPRAYSEVEAPPGTLVRIRLTGNAGGEWDLRRHPDRWAVLPADDGVPSASLELPADLAWRWLARLVPVEEARRQMTLDGEIRLIEPAVEAVSIMTASL